MAEPEFRDGAWWFRQPDGTLLRWEPVRALLWVIAGVSLIAAVSDAFEVELLGRIEAGEHVSDAETSFNDIRQSVIGVVQTLAFIATIVLFLMWFSCLPERRAPRRRAAPIRARLGDRRLVRSGPEPLPPEADRE